MTDDRHPREAYDVAILGGGLAGLTLALQLKQSRPDTSIFIAEKRLGAAPEAAFKVGESTQEIACNYFGDVLGLMEHMEKDQIRKCGLRFWFPAGDNSSLAERIERGPAAHAPIPSWQFDRGRFENYLGDENLEAGIDLFGATRVTDVEIGDPHRVTIAPRAGGEESTVQARWLVDASGRSWILKRKLGLLEENGHMVNSVWFRMAGGLDIEEWADPDDEEFFGRMSERGLRQFSTNHLCGKGYWMWMIPLSSGPISIGIVADPSFHAMDEMNTLDKAIDWIRGHEPQLGDTIDARRDQVEDFLKVEDFSYGAKQVFSGNDRWCLVGEAGAFLDPFYSPGSDFIALSNTLTTDLISRELDGEDVVQRAEAHDDFYLNAYRVHLTQYEGQYVFWDNPAVMNVKISGNNIYYWGCLGLLFFHRKLTDLALMAAVRPDMERMWAIITTARGDVPRMERARAARVAPGDRSIGRLPGHVRSSPGHGCRVRRRGSEGKDGRQRRPAGGVRGARLQPRRAEPRRRRAGRGPEDQPLRGQPRPRALGGRRVAGRRGSHRDRGSRVAGGRNGEPVHGGDRDARVTLVGHADP